MDKGKSMDATNSRAGNRRNTCNSIGSINSMDKGKSKDNTNSRAGNRRNTCNSMGASISMDKGKSMDATLIKKKIKFSSHIRKFRMEQLQSQI
jgi:hypothetical protein